MATATNIVGNGAHTYEYDRAWAQVPDGIPMPAAAVFGDDEDRVYCFKPQPGTPHYDFRPRRKVRQILGRRNV